MNEDNLYAAGSDDFRGYVWKIPSATQLMEQRQKFSADEWSTSNLGRIGKIENKNVHHLTRAMLNITSANTYSLYRQQEKINGGTRRNRDSSLLVDRSVQSPTTL